MSDSEYTQSLWYETDSDVVCIVDQTLLPQQFLIRELNSLQDVCEAICVMRVRGAPLIGVTAAYGLSTLLFGKMQRAWRGPLRLYLIRAPQQ